MYRDYFGNLKRGNFGYIADDVTLAPPLRIANPKNVFLYGDNGLRNADIMTTNAKFIMKPHSGAAEGLRVTTGNHAMILGRYYRTITESEKPQGLDKDVIVLEYYCQQSTVFDDILLFTIPPSFSFRKMPPPFTQGRRSYIIAQK